MTQLEKLTNLVNSQSFLFDTPVGIYVVTLDGDFIRCNDRVRQILDIPPESPLPKSIKEFYYDPDERDTTLQEMMEKLNLNSKVWLEKDFRFKVKGREKFIKDYTRAIYDPDTGETLGLLCCMIDVTDEKLYREMFESLPVGLYQLDANDKIIEISEAATEMLGYSAKDEIINADFKVLFADPHEEKKFTEEVRNEGAVSKEIVELLKGGVPMFASLSAFSIFTDEEEYVGQVGAMIDVTTEELYRRLLEHVPVGLYQISERNGKDIITDCNKPFALLNGFTSIEEAKGRDIKEFHASEQTYNAYIQALIDSGEEPLHGYPLQVKAPNGEIATYEVNSRLLFDKNGNRIGRAGSMRDVSDKKEKAKLRHRVDELTEDIGRVLHTYSASLVKIQNSLNVVVQSLGPSPFKKGFNLMPERASAELQAPVNQLATSLDLLFTSSRTEWGSAALSVERWQRLKELSGILHNYRSLSHPEIHPSTVRTASFEILQISNEIQRGKLAKDPVRQVRNNVHEVLRICNLISLHQLLDLTLAMDHAVFTLREFVTSEKRQQEQKTVCKVSTLISQAISNLNEFAINRDVNFRFNRKQSTDALVEVIERDASRALDNLLHNAIKYSWEREKGKSPWVSIHTFTNRNRVLIEIQNWGVPIPNDEIEGEQIFETGFRGRLSSDRGRAGTGIGLADARRVAREHGGELTIRSIPAIFGRDAQDYKQPFLTTATLILPIHSD
jgi:PAS domain S-box-containing protein